MTPTRHILGRIRAALVACLFREIAPKSKLPSLGFRGALIVLAVIVAGVVILRGAVTAGVYVDKSCVSRSACFAILYLAERVVPFLPHSTEGGMLLVEGEFAWFNISPLQFSPEMADEWPGLEHAKVWVQSDLVQVPNFPAGYKMPRLDKSQGRSIWPETFKPPLEFHALAALSALAFCCSGAWLARSRQEQHRIRSIQIAFVVALTLIIGTLFAAFAAWSGPQLVRIFWERVFDASGHDNAPDRVWVQPALCETSGLLVFGIMYAACLFTGAWWAAKFLLGVKGLSHSHRRIMRCDGVAHCGRCGHQLDNLTTCPECGLAQSDLPPRGWPWNSRWFRTQRARRVTLLLLVGTAVTVSAALPLIVGVAQVLLKRL